MAATRCLRNILCALGLLVAAHAAAAEPLHWVASWAAPPAPPLLTEPSAWPTAPLTPSFHNQTVVQTLRLSTGGKGLRLRLSNEYGTAPLTVGAVRIVLLAPDGKTESGASIAVTFSGNTSVAIPPHAPLVSDPIDLSAPALSLVQVSLYLPDDTGPATTHFFAMAKIAVSPPGDFTDRPFTPAATIQCGVFLSEVDVERPGDRPVIVAFGDSITDGNGSTMDANHRWPDILAERLQPLGDAVVNEGIGGNQVLGDAGIASFGQGALARFDRDALSVPGVTHLIVLEGINDIGVFPSLAPAALIAGYRQIIARAHIHGLKVILGTLLPYKGAAYYSAQGETLRQAVNAWIRTQHESDGVVDFDAVMRDPADPSRFLATLQSGDWLHPNDDGYRIMADAIDLKLLQ